MVQLQIYHDPSTLEYLLLELQGSIHFLDPEHRNLGTLDWTIPELPVLTIGHHRLTGSIVHLSKPLVVLSKNKGNDTIMEQADNLDTGSTEAHGQDMTSFTIQSVIRKKCVFKTRPEHILSSPFVGLNTFTEMR